MTASKNSLRVTQFIHGELKKVFQAWTDADRVVKWLCPEECRVIATEAKVDVGGSYRETMKCGSDMHTVFGTYREIIPNRKLIFTHQWEEPNAVQTEVAVIFADKDNGSQVTLTQKGFMDAATQKGHEEGWAGALRNLAKQFP